ncbi:hypothetical protein ACTXPA_09770 [Glutamicibacter arilaitensis]|nr:MULTISPECIES: hypothetical protein [Glutamicibacter]
MTQAPALDTTAGRPWPLGVTVDASGANVAVYAPKARAVYFCWFPEGDDAEEHRLALPYVQDGI